jgi:hypothetical protein
MAEISQTDGYQLRLHGFLKQYHPYLFTEEQKQSTIDFIVLRASEAAKAYKSAWNKGGTPIECDWEANETLHAGFEFSPITYLTEICQNATGYEMTAAEACEIYGNPQIKEILDRYGTDIEGDDREHLCVEELASFFKKYEGITEKEERYLDDLPSW